MFGKTIVKPVGTIYRRETTPGIPGWLVLLGGVVLLAAIFG